MGGTRVSHLIYVHHNCIYLHISQNTALKMYRSVHYDCNYWLIMALTAVIVSL